jgi:agmatine deiminase
MRVKYQNLILLILFFTGNITAQEVVPEWRKKHYLSEEEMHKPLLHVATFEETDPPVAPIRNVAEYDPMQSVLVRYPFGVPLSLIKELADEVEVVTIVANESQELAVTSQYSGYGVNLDHCSFLYAPTNSYWVRDYGPWFVFDGNDEPGIVNFPYNRPRPNDDNIPDSVASMLGITAYGMNLIHTGGNYMTNGLGQSASTDLVLEENPDLTQEDIDSLVMRYLHVEDYHLLADPLDDYIKHIDTWGKFLTPGKVLIGQVPETDYRYDDFEAAADFFATTVSGYGKSYEVFRVFTPGGSPATPYTNSLIVNDRVFVPLTGSQYDDDAIASYEEAMPGYEIIGINYGGWLNTDALHCRAKGVADLGMLYIDHMPILGTVIYEESYELTADIKAYSDEEIYPDSVLIYYRLDDGEFTSSTMTYQSGDTWKGYIEDVGPGDHVDYYIYVADESGRHMMHPYIGISDPHSFYAFGLQTDVLMLDPDTLSFETVEECIDGKELYVINISNNPIDVSYITPGSDGAEFMWWVDGIPDLPHTLDPDDTVTLQIFVGLPTAHREEYLFDDLVVTSLDDEYKCVIAGNSEIVGVDETGFDPAVEIFPNPFSKQVNFRFFMERPGNAELLIYDGSGRLIYHDIGNYSQGTQEIRLEANQLQVAEGMLFYKLKTTGQQQSGRVIFRR